MFSLDQLSGMSTIRPVPGFLLQEELVAPENQRGPPPCPGDGRRLPPDLLLLWIVSYCPVCTQYYTQHKQGRYFSRLSCHV